MWLDAMYDPRAGRRGVARFGLLALWVLLTLALAWKHAVWRDEVRALSFALGGSNVFAMLKGMHGEGHPAIWYLMLRGAHAVIRAPWVLQVVAYAVGLAAMVLLVLKSPFRVWMVALILFGRFGVYEYVVMARNYGISMLVMFLLAWLYPKHRERGFVVGGLLFLLANTNAQSVLLVGAFLVFWLLDAYWGESELRAARLRVFWMNVPVALVGIVLCAVTILPTLNDGAMFVPPHGAALVAWVGKALLLPATALELTVHMSTMVKTLGKVHLGNAVGVFGAELALSILLVASVLGLRRRPAALAGAVAAMVGFVLFFAVIYPGGFRHQALWLVFLLTMYWIAGSQDAPAGGGMTRVGYGALALILLVQVANGLTKVGPGLLKDRPESRVRDLAQMIQAAPELKDAVVVAAPDYLLEALPYYVPNETYLIREQRFGKIVFFTRKARLKIGLDDVLSEARALKAKTGKPVIVLLGHEPDPYSVADAASVSGPAVLDEGYDWELVTDAEQAGRFRAGTRLLKQFGMVGADSTETFNAYLVN